MSHLNSSSGRLRFGRALSFLAAAVPLLSAVAGCTALTRPEEITIAAEPIPAQNAPAADAPAPAPMPARAAPAAGKSGG